MRDDGTKANGTVGAWVSGVRAKLAVTLVVAFTVTLQVPVVLVQAPPQPEKVEPDDGVAVRTAAVPVFTVTTQVEPQLRPEPVTVPEPVPDLEAARAKVATTLFTVTMTEVEVLVFPAASRAIAVRV